MKSKAGFEHLEMSWPDKVLNVDATADHAFGIVIACSGPLGATRSGAG